MPAGYMADGAVGRKPPCAAGAWRCRRLIRPAPKGRRRAGRRKEADGRRDAHRERDHLSRHERQAAAVRQCQGAPGGSLRDPLPKIMDAAMFGRGIPMFGGPTAVTAPVWPQPHPYVTDLARAKQLLAEAGHEGFETTLSFDLGFAVTNEPLCVLVQESLAQIGIKVRLNKIPGANWRAEFSKKTLPFIANAFGGWLNFPDYFFYWTYHGQ